MAFAVVAVLIQSALVEAFRDSMQLLTISYLVIIIIMAVVYMLLEPVLLHSLREKYGYHKSVESDLPAPLCDLTQRELEVTDLLCHGYSNREIAMILFISEHTAKDHTKNIYRKLGVHSRFELAAMINRMK